MIGANGSAERRSVLAVALLVLFTVAAHVAGLYRPNTWINRDGRFYANTNTTIVEDLSFEQPFAASWYNGALGWNRNLPASFSNIALGRHGEHWPMHPYLMPVLSTPLFFAFGLFGTLIFNVMLFGVAAYAAFVFARAYAPPAAAVAAVATLLLSTAIHEYAYDYHVDVLLLGLLCTGLAGLVRGRGALLGVCYAMMLIVKPTSLLFLPAILLILWESSPPSQTSRRSVLKQAILGGAVVIGLAACVNTYLFGRPWWFGYNRVLIVVGGEQTIESDVEAFSTPLVEGLRKVWSGPWGLRHRQTMIALAAPGLLALLWKRPRYALGAAATAAMSLVVFAQYKYEGDRFHWPAIVLLLPALATTFHLIGDAAARLDQRIRGRWHGLRNRRRAEAGTAIEPGPVAAGEPTGPTPTPAPTLQQPTPKTPSRSGWRSAIIAAATVALATASSLPFADNLEERLGDSALVLGAMSFAEQGTFDLRERLGDDYLRGRRGDHSPITRGRFGHWLPRSSPAALIIAAPFAAIGGYQGLALLGLLALFVAVYAGVRLLSAHVPAPVAGVAAIAPLVLQPIRELALLDLSSIIALALGLYAVSTARAGRFAVGGCLGALAAWVGDAPLPFVVGVLILAHFAGKPALRRAAVAVALTLSAWGLVHLLVIGRPFASPDDFVLAEVAGSLEAVAIAPSSTLEAFSIALASPGRGWLLALILGAATGLSILSVRMPRLALPIAAAVASMLVPGGFAGVEADAAPGLGRLPTVVLLLALPCSVVAMAVAAPVADWFGRARPRGRWAVLGALVASLLLVGTVRRVGARLAPFQLGSEQAMRRAEVHLGDAPCDFIPWEHMSWECSHLDRGHFNQVGLALPEGVVVGGRQEPMLLIPTGLNRQARTVRWRGLAPASRLSLRFAVPDNLPGNVRVTVEANGLVVDSFESPALADGHIHQRPIALATSGDLDLTLRVEPLGEAGAAIAVDGSFD